GDFPDPSIVRKENDYYIATSTFQYFPAVTISHSQDLANWEIVGHAVTESDWLDLTGVADSAGIWAPDISYYDGKFWITTTLQTKEFAYIIVCHSEKAEGPYSKPHTLIKSNRHSDPSIFNDDDGRRYLASSHGRVQEISKDAKKFIGEEKEVWEGTGKHCPEGPHIFKRNGYYYLICAEGGTGYNHCEVAARSKDIWGPYEANPANPVLGPAEENFPIQKTGHGKPVQAQNGDWYFVFLGSRPYGGRYSNLGRETFIAPLEWNNDGWFTIKPPQLSGEIQGLTPCPAEDAPENEFSSDKLLLNWQFDRNPDKGIFSNNAGTISISNNIYTRRQQHKSFTAETEMVIAPENSKSESGLTIYTDSTNYLRLYIYENKLSLIKNSGGGKTEEKSEILFSENYNLDNIYLKATAEEQSLQFIYSENGCNWIKAGQPVDSRFLSPESVSACRKKCFTGVRIGIFNKGKENYEAVFSSFKYTPA
ncbi:MAG: glycoside hydrolase family 43 protein, partial [Planctomycetota bacterium]